MNILSIDTGKHSAWALYRDGVLTAFGKFDPDKDPWPPVGEFHGVAVVEVPESRGGNTPASTGSLMKLASRAGAIVGACKAHRLTVIKATPRRWKGGIDKKTSWERVLKRLSRAELDLIGPRVSFDEKDAIGIGIWACDRGWKTAPTL